MAYIANPQDLDMYACVLNNPLNKTDPTGMNVCSTNGNAAIRINGGGPVPVVGGTDAATGRPYAEGILVHIAGLPTAENPLGGTGMTHSGKAISEGCQLICSTQYHDFEQVTGMRPSDGSQPQQHFTVTVNTTENQP